MLEIYVGVLAATILFIATNAGVIGASRVTYSMASYRQIPEVFRRLHPTFKTPVLSLVLFAGIAPILIILPGDVNFVGTLYSFGATLSFTVAHASLVRLRMKQKGAEGIFYRARPNLLIRGVDWPLFAIAGGIATGASFLVIVVQNPTTRWVGLGWIAFGMLFYVVYRRRFVRASLTNTVKAPPAFGPALALQYRRLLVPVVSGQPSDDALDVACSLAAERGAQIVAVNVLEVPLDRPLDTDMEELEDAANRRARRGDRDRRLVRRARPRPPRPRPQRRRRDRAGGGAARDGDHRDRDAAEDADAVAEGRVRQHGRLRAPPRTLPRARRGLAGGGVGVIWYRRSIYVFSVLFVVIGLALLVVTAVNGGGLTGFLLGALFVALGVGRIQLERKRGA